MIPDERPWIAPGMPPWAPRWPLALAALAVLTEVFRGWLR